MIAPDAFTGALLAAEGLKDGAVMLNGPTGCKFHHGALCEALYPRSGSLDPLRSSDRFYFGQHRVPCTYLEDEDYVSGTARKLDEAMPVILSKGHSMITVINSPGAALIGDDLKRIVQRSHPNVPVAIMETCAFSQGLGQGFQDCLIGMLDAVPLQPAERMPTINLVGVSIMDHGWENGTRQLKRLLSLCGIKVGAVLSAGSTVKELSTARSATLSVVLDPEMGGRVANHLRTTTGVVRISPGQPIGFRGTSRWVKEICDALGKDPSPALDVIRQEERRCAFQLARHSSLTGLPKGATFSVRARSSIVLGLLEFLHGYLGMVPVCVDCIDDGSGEVRAYLQRNGLAEAMDTVMFEQPCHIMLGDGNDLCMASSTLGVPGIEISPPYRGVARIRDVSLWGEEGAVDLLDAIVRNLGDRW